MQTTNSSSQHEEQLRAVITQFLFQLHETGGASISHVTVTVHGEPKHFSADQSVNALAVTKMNGVATLSYQEMKVDAPIANMVTVITTENQAGTV